jgi:hypothetical protein
MGHIVTKGSKIALIVLVKVAVTVAVVAVWFAENVH